MLFRDSQALSWLYRALQRFTGSFLARQASNRTEGVNNHTRNVELSRRDTFKSLPSVFLYYWYNLTTSIKWPSPIDQPGQAMGSF